MKDSFSHFKLHHFIFSELSTKQGQIDYDFGKDCNSMAMRYGKCIGSTSKDWGTSEDENINV